MTHHQALAIQHVEARSGRPLRPVRSSARSRRA
jgi:hypothetical protein